MPKHYHLFVITKTKKDFERVYFEMESPDESKEDGLDRYLEEQLGDRKRNRAKEKESLAAKIESHKLCHPSSWWASERENGNGTPVTASKKTRRK